MRTSFLIIIATLFGINCSAQGWIQKSNLGGVGRVFGEAFSIGNYGYMGLGQQDVMNNRLRDFWQYDPVSDSWTQVADFGGTARYGAIGFAIGSLGYVGLGWDGAYQADFWEYDPPPANVWTQKTNFTGTPMAWREGFATSTRGYAGLGHNGGSAYATDFYEFDPTDPSNGLDGNGRPMGVWTRRADFGGVGRDYALGFAINDRGYMGLGFSKIDFTGPRNDFWEYDPATDTWAQIANYPGSGLRSTLGFEVNNRGYVGTGFVGAITNAFRDFWEYNPNDNTWLQVCNLGAEGRFGAESFVINDVAYVGLGRSVSDIFLNDLWELQSACGGALPVELLSFSAKWQDETYNSAVINWQTANEINNDYFEVERSIDAINFSTIMQIDGLNNSIPTDYQELDPDPFKESVSYYRLKQVDYDGTFTYSQIEALNIPEGLEIINLYPNPVNDKLNFSILSSLNGEIEIRITNALGQNIFTKSKSINEGITSINVDLPNVGDGNYYLEIALSNGKYKSQAKFIVNKKN